MSKATERYKKTKEWKLQNARDAHRYYCYCGHSVHIYGGKFGNNSVTCSWCKRRVYANPEEQEKAIERYKKEDFRLKMLRTMKGEK